MKNKKSPSIKILRYFKYAKKEIIIMSILMLVTCIIGILNPIIGANLLTSVTNFDINRALSFAILMVVLAIISSIEGHLTLIVYSKKIKLKVFLKMRQDMLKNILSMKMCNFDNHSTGEFSERVKSDPDRVSRIITVVQWSFFNMIKDFFILIYIFFVSPLMGIVYLITVILIYLFQKYAYKKSEKLAEEERKISDKVLTLLTETIRGIRDIKVLNISNPIKKMMGNKLNDFSYKEAEKVVANDFVYESSELLKAICTFIVILVGIFSVKNALLSITNLLIIFMYRNDVYDIILCYSGIKENLIEYKIAAERIFELEDEEKFPKEKFGKKVLENVSGNLSIHNLSFAYNKKEILHDINLNINKNDTIGIVGESGSGKTTLLNLLSKSYDVDNNKIYIDGNDINELSMESIRNNIAVISQNPYIFNLTIKDNLKLMNNNITNEEIIRVCKIAQIHEYIESLPNKYDTLLGEGGMTLSGGQRQRLAIARALLKKSKIILFDEATSALDNITQKHVSDALATLKCTRIVIAHRLSTIRQCDRILVRDAGKIVEEGTPEEIFGNPKEKRTQDFLNKVL